MELGACTECSQLVGLDRRWAWLGNLRAQTKLTIWFHTSHFGVAGQVACIAIALVGEAFLAQAEPATRACVARWRALLAWCRQTAGMATEACLTTSGLRSLAVRRRCGCVLT